MGELKLTGNCLKGSRPLLSFDESFDASPQYSLLKELFIQVLSFKFNISPTLKLSFLLTILTDQLAEPSIHLHCWLKPSDCYNI